MKENKEQFTVNQHYIPQVYLRGFSPKYSHSSNISNSKYTIYMYDIYKEKQFGEIPIKSICYKKNLYELTNEDGDFVFRNHLEKWFNSLENMYASYRRKLENKAFLDNNYNKNCFLTREEKDFWILYIAVQFFRMPNIINMAEEYGKEFFGNEVTDSSLRNIARNICLPFFREITEDSKEAFIFDMMVRPMMDMSFGVGVDTSKGIFTSDVPVYISAREFPATQFEDIIFPITSEICMFLSNKANTNNCRKNYLFHIDEKDKTEIINAILKQAKMIYSNHKLNDKELDYINAVISKNE